MSLRKRPKRLLPLLLSATGLILVYLFQKQLELTHLLNLSLDHTQAFVVNRTFRFLVNDLLALWLIFSIFGERKYLMVAVAVQIAGVVFLLIPYFIIRIYFQPSSASLISFLHRLVVNPTLLLLLIPAFYYQQRVNKAS